MNIEILREYCLHLPFTEEKLPFDDTTLVFCVCGKMFAMIDLDNATSVNLKCDPERAITLRETYSGIIAGWHMNKKHWNTVFFDSDVSDKLILAMTEHSYSLVWQKLPKKIRENFLPLNQQSNKQSK